MLIAQAAHDFDWPSDADIGCATRAYSGAQRSYFVSRHNLQTTEKQLGIRLTNAKLVFNPFKVSYNALPDWPDESTYRLACVARLNLKSKGQDMLFEAFSSEKWRSRNIEISLFGDGEDLGSLRRLKEFFRLGNLNFMGHVANIEAVWATHHALVLPSRFEGLPIALVEAMLCGRPAIITPVGGNAEILEDDVTGFLATAPTIRSIEETLERAWQRRVDWKQMGQHAASAIRGYIPPDTIQHFVDELAAEVSRG